MVTFNPADPAYVALISETVRSIPATDQPSFTTLITALEAFSKQRETTIPADLVGRVVVLQEIYDDPGSYVAPPDHLSFQDFVVDQVKQAALQFKSWSISQREMYVRESLEKTTRAKASTRAAAERSAPPPSVAPELTETQIAERAAEDLLRENALFETCLTRFHLQPFMIGRLLNNPYRGFTPLRYTPSFDAMCEDVGLSPLAGLEMVHRHCLNYLVARGIPRAFLDSLAVERIGNPLGFGRQCLFVERAERITSLLMVGVPVATLTGLPPPRLDALLTAPEPWPWTHTEAMATRYWYGLGSIVHNVKDFTAIMALPDEEFREVVQKCVYINYFSCKGIPLNSILTLAPHNKRFLFSLCNRDNPHFGGIRAPLLLSLNAIRDELGGKFQDLRRQKRRIA